MKIIDNINSLLGDDLEDSIIPNSKVVSKKAGYNQNLGLTQIGSPLVQLSSEEPNNIRARGRSIQSFLGTLYDF